MPLHPQASALLEQVHAAGIDLTQLAPAAVREVFEAMASTTSRQSVARVEELLIPGPESQLRARLYAAEADAPLPVMVFFHGGGFIAGSLESHDGLCRDLANVTGSAVVSVDYRLAPEHKFPAAPEDCYAATCWIAHHAAALGFDASRVSVGGDSAGGCLAAVVDQLCCERNGPELLFQLLIYPVLDCRFDTGSYAENADGYLLTRAQMEFFWSHYLVDSGQTALPMASPLQSSDFRSRSTAFIITAEFDPLRDEGEAYARKLQQSGVTASVSRYDGMMHGFLGSGVPMDAAKRALREISAHLNRVLVRSRSSDAACSINACARTSPRDGS